MLGFLSYIWFLRNSSHTLIITSGGIMHLHGAITCWTTKLFFFCLCPFFAIDLYLNLQNAFLMQPWCWQLNFKYTEHVFAAKTVDSLENHVYLPMIDSVWCTFYLQLTVKRHFNSMSDKSDYCNILVNPLALKKLISTHAALKKSILVLTVFTRLHETLDAPQSPSSTMGLEVLLKCMMRY